MPAATALTAMRRQGGFFMVCFLVCLGLGLFGLGFLFFLAFRKHQ